MKIDYPVIAPSDIKPGDTVLRQSQEGTVTCYYEFIFEHGDLVIAKDSTYYLIDRPRAKFPEEYGSVIIAKRVRGIDFPEGVAMMRQRGSNYGYSHTKPLWKSVGTKITGADNHGENHIEDWVLAQIVPVEENK